MYASMIDKLSMINYNASCTFQNELVSSSFALFAKPLLYQLS